MREGKSYLGLTGSLLKEYAVEAAKKENLLRKSLGVKRESSMSSESEELKELHSTQFTRPRSNSVNSATQTDVTVGAKATDSNLETAVPTMPELPREATPAMHIGAPAMPVTSRPSRPRSFSKLSSGTAQGALGRSGDFWRVFFRKSHCWLICFGMIFVGDLECLSAVLKFWPTCPFQSS